MTRSDNVIHLHKLEHHVRAVRSTAVIAQSTVMAWRSSADDMSRRSLGGRLTGSDVYFLTLQRRQLRCAWHSLGPLPLDFSLKMRCENVAQVRADLEAHAPRALAVARPLRVVISNLPPGHVETVQAKVPPRQPTLPLPEMSQERGSTMLMDFGLHRLWQCSALVLYSNVWSPAHRTSCMTAAWRFVNASCRP